MVASTVFKFADDMITYPNLMFQLEIRRTGLGRGA